MTNKAPRQDGSPIAGTKLPVAAGEHATIDEIAKVAERVRLLETQLAHQITAAKREQTSLLKLVMGMAIAGYRYDPRATRSTVTKEIAGDLVRVGVQLDEDTVLKWLRRGIVLLPPQEPK